MRQREGPQFIELNFSSHTESVLESICVAEFLIQSSSTLFLYRAASSECHQQSPGAVPLILEQMCKIGQMNQVLNPTFFSLHCLKIPGLLNKT